MLTSTTHQQSLDDAGSETRPPMLERGSYIPWVSRFKRYLNQKRENIKWLNKAIDEGPYVFKNFTLEGSQTPTLQTEDDLIGDDLKHYEAEIEAMNLILISIPNDIYNSVDACTTAQAMWQRVERLMRGTIQNKVDRETRFNNEFDQFVAEPGEALVSLTEDSYNDLFDYISQYEKLVNASRAKKLEKSHDPLALVAHMGSSSRNSSPYRVTHPLSVVDYDDDYQWDTFQNNSKDPLISVMMLLARAITQRDKVNIQSQNSGNDGRNTRRSFVLEEIIEGNNVHNDVGNIQRTLLTTSSGSAANVRCYNCSEKGTSYDSTFLSEIQNPSTSFVNPLFAKDNQEQKYLKQPEIINNTIGDDQIDSNIIFDEPNVDINSGNVKYDNNVQASYELEQLARNAYKDAEKQQINAKRVKQQNNVLTQQLELYKEKVRIFEMTKRDKETFLTNSLRLIEKQDE
ncbi:hypothetical protein Tco_1414908 [Tanacetum coccineum]